MIRFVPVLILRPSNMTGFVVLYTIHKRTADAVRAALRVEGTSLEEGAEVVLFAHREPRAAGSVLALMHGGEGRPLAINFQAGLRFKIIKEHSLTK